MTPTMLKFSAEEKGKFADALVDESFVKLLAKIKEAPSESGTFEVIFTNGVVDRHGETVNPDGWDFTNYMKNAVVLYAHDYSSLPVGIVDEINRDGGNWIAKGRFAPDDASPMAGYVRKLYEAGFLKTVSVGFMPLEMDANYNSIKQELLEISFVPVPANPEALALAKEFGLDVEELKTKGLFADVKTTEPTPDASETAPETVEEPKVEPEPTPDPVEEAKAQMEATVKTLEDQVATLKAGRVLSDSNRTLIRDCADGLRSSILTMEKSVSALEDLLKSTEPSTGGDSDEPTEESKGVNLVHLQRLVRIADKSIEDALRVIGRGVKR